MEKVFILNQAGVWVYLGNLASSNGEWLDIHFKLDTYDDKSYYSLPDYLLGKGLLKIVKEVK